MKRRIDLRAVFVAAVLLAFFLTLPMAARADAVPSFGEGPYEVMIFSDYFCPPCKAIDTKAAMLFKELVATGGVKLTFVDVPFSRMTPTYSRYYLYAMHVSQGLERAIMVREVLFAAAQEKGIQSEGALLSYLTQRGVAWKAMDEKAVFSLLTALRTKHQIGATPTCVISHPSKGDLRLVGSDDIWNGLNQLRDELRKE